MAAPTAATVTDDLVAAATAGNGPAMLSLSRRLDYGQSVGGKDRQGWLAAAAAAGEVKAKIALARQDGDGGAVEASLDRVAAGGVCQPDQMADLAMAYVALDAPTPQPRPRSGSITPSPSAISIRTSAFALGQALAAGDRRGGYARQGNRAPDRGSPRPERSRRCGSLRPDTHPAPGATPTRRSPATGSSVPPPPATRRRPSSFAEQAASAERPDPAESPGRTNTSSRRPARLRAPRASLASSASGASSARPSAPRGSHWLQVAADAGDRAPCATWRTCSRPAAAESTRDPGRALEWLRKAADGRRRQVDAQARRRL